MRRRWLMILSLTTAATASLPWFDPMRIDADDGADVQSLVDKMKSLEPWRQSSDYSKKNWEAALRTASIVQETSSALVEKALDAFMAKATTGAVKGDYEEESKPFLLMRIVFELPENADPKDAFSFKGWDNASERLKGGLVNLAWPVSWTATGPKLLARYEGSSGKPYAAVEEYRFMKARFKLRKLKE